MPHSEEEYNQLLADVARLNRETREKDKTIRGYKGLASRNKVELPEQKQEQPPKVQEEPKKPAHEETLKPWQYSCPTCGEKNPDYKPETKCANCSGPLGSVEVAKKLDFCPHCGEKSKFVPLTEEAKQKVAAMIGT